MNFVHEVINAIANQPTSTWTTLGAYLGGSTLVASLVQILKHKLNFADAKKALVAVTGFISFLAAFANLVLSNSTQLSGLQAIPWLGHVTLLLLGGATVIHRFLVSPGYYKLAAGLQKASNWLDAVKTVETQNKTTNTSVVTSAVTSGTSSLPDESNLTQFQV